MSCHHGTLGMESALSKVFREHADHMGDSSTNARRVSLLSLTLFEDDILHRFLCSVGWDAPRLRITVRYLLSPLIVGWVPLAALAWLEGNAIGPTLSRSMLYDFAAHGQVLISAILLFSEKYMDKNISSAGEHLVKSGIVVDRGAYRSAVWELYSKRRHAGP